MLRNILDGIEALATLERFGTVSEAATRLRLTQSAVSKRLQALQRSVGFRVVEPEGRRLRLTAEALELLERARPLLAELRALASPSKAEMGSSFSLALADSIAASWGPAVVAKALSELSDVQVSLHAHRSVLLMESVRLGRYQVGLSTEAPTPPDVLHYPVTEEPMVHIYSSLGAKPGKAAPLITIEPGSATWRAIEAQLRQHQPELLRRALVPVESFSAALQMVKAGFGDGLAPLGLALEMRLPRSSYRELPGVRRRVSLLTRKTVHHLASFGRLRDGIIAAAAEYFSKRRTWG
ncbi:LysR family transcriptional regulator [Hyalangium versicolor]|uniref:LysR family transcriptional regulator n=1 Tax=Hyalangium versicolor TaxID=2861190 RepID=UPI001CC956D1|nr:LysR family transcriptional regulator [Hyalangium versicolor]